MKYVFVLLSICLFSGVLANPRRNLYKRKFKIHRDDLPTEVDWREQGAVTNVKNSGECGGPVYALVDVFESQNFIINGQLVPLSSQELIDCVTDTDCGGFDIMKGYEYVIENGLASAADYPPDNDGTCRMTSVPASVLSSGYSILYNDTENIRWGVVNEGPMLVSVDASTWIYYVSGVHSCENPEPANHVALLVGYGTEDGIDYWLVKSTWGEGWGEQGYIKVQRGEENDCGLTLDVSYPVVDRVE